MYYAMIFNITEDTRASKLFPLLRINDLLYFLFHQTVENSLLIK